MIHEIENFLTESECDYLIGLIDANNTRSGVTGGKEQSTKVDEKFRTSSTCYFDISDNTVSNIKNKISQQLGIQEKKGEPLQGQLYKPGEYFKKHNDWFAEDSYNYHCLHSGNRTHTFMIYLNDDLEGGETFFHNLNIKIKPKKGKAVFWKNLENGEGIRDALHSGEPVITGKKYIITSWWRENTWDGFMDSVMEAKKFSGHDDFPRFSKKGFSVIKVPGNAWNLIQEMYKEIKPLATEEIFNDKENFIKGNGVTSEIMSLGEVWQKRDELHEMLRPVHENWVEQKLIPSAVYGIRSYLNSATLETHVDKLLTHHVSSIIIVDKDLNGQEDWALNVQAHDGSWVDIHAKVGEMILYESAACNHGRTTPFKGNYFRNMFVHYKLADWRHEG